MSIASNQTYTHLPFAVWKGTFRVSINKILDGFLSVNYTFVYYGRDTGIHVCMRRSHVDQATGKLNVIGIFDRIRSKKFPFTHRSCIIAAKIACQEGEHTAVFHFKDSAEEDIMPPSPPAKFVSPPLGTNTVIVEVKGLRFPKEGFYEIQMFVDDQFAKKTDIIVDRVK